MRMPRDLPIAVIGTGPVGLAAAVHLIARGLPVKVYESGASVAANVRAWGHVRLFSPWQFNTDPAATALLRRHGWQAPPDQALPTGQDLVDAYLAPLAQTPELLPVVETDAKVRHVSRQGIDKVVSRDRETHPFTLTIENASGRMRIDPARAVIDASGTWQNPNPLGANGVPAIGETEARAHIAYGIPDVLGRERASYAGKRVLVVGGGHSAANALLDLARLAESDRALRITWAVRGTNLTRIFGGGEADKLAARGQLGSDLKALVTRERLDLVLGFAALRVDQRQDGIAVTGITDKSEQRIGPFDRIIVATGLRPDLEMTRELRLDLDPWLECPRALGPLIDPNLHSCGSVRPHGHKALAHHEAGYFTVGIKSYGRAPTFLMATGYEQVRSIAAHLAGDHVAADKVELVLPETGICSSSYLKDLAAPESCCGGPPLANTQGCCAEDEAAKAEGASGCGCAPKPEVQGAQASTCCTPA
ncbi:MAG: NAD(P)-binding domain-containing protein [Alphaproteobacteria bacterium]|nr:NAD(P)-binding domain-containing protein [Alphaproteobacteria bacterium]